MAIIAKRPDILCLDTRFFVATHSNRYITCIQITRSCLLQTINLVKYTNEFSVTNLHCSYGKGIRKLDLNSRNTSSLIEMYGFWDAHICSKDPVSWKFVKRSDHVDRRMALALSQHKTKGLGSRFSMLDGLLLHKIALMSETRIPMGSAEVFDIVRGFALSKSSQYLPQKSL